MQLSSIIGVDVIIGLVSLYAIMKITEDKFSARTWLTGYCVFILLIFLKSLRFVLPPVKLKNTALQQLNERSEDKKYAHLQN